jgi:hypothetical protein
MVAPSKRSESSQASSVGRLASLARGVSEHLGHAVSGMQRVNMQARLLSLNARIEAARAGDSGRAFGVVAAEMASLSERTSTLTADLATRTKAELAQLDATLEHLGAEIRGVRLSDLALSNIDLIDRNLYERSCDVRWWATDAAVVDALARPDAAQAAYASSRLGVILDAYTVYYDIVLCDLHGRVVANGRPARWRSVGRDMSGTGWFREAIATRDGSEFGFRGVHRDDGLAGGELILVYSCAVREGGRSDGRVLGVLGIVFNWAALAQTIVKRTPIPEEERGRTRVCIVDSTGLVLADADDARVLAALDLPDRAAVFASGKSHRVVEDAGVRTMVAHAVSPGYETYRTGWHSLIVQTLTE